MHEMIYVIAGVSEFVNFSILNVYMCVCVLASADVG